MRTVFVWSVALAAVLVVGGCRLVTSSQESIRVGVHATLQTSTGTPVPLFEVTVLETGAKTTSAANGDFWFPLPNGVYHLYVTTDWSNALSESFMFPPQQVTVTKPSQDLGAWKARTPSTLGRATSGDTGFPGVVMTIAALADPTTILGRSISTTDEAMFAFFDLLDGEYLVTGSSADYSMDTEQIRIAVETKNGVPVQVTNVWDAGTALYSTYDHYATDFWTVGGTPVLGP